MDDPWAAFVAARLDEEHWEAFKFHRDGLRWQTEMLASLFGRSEYDPVIRHVSRYDPARAMREVAAKRVILALHNLAEHYCPLPVVPGRHGQLWTTEEGACWTLRQLAAIWSDHGDYPGRVDT